MWHRAFGEEDWCQPSGVFSQLGKSKMWATHAVKQRTRSGGRRYRIQQEREGKAGWFLEEVRFELRLERGSGRDVGKKGTTQWTLKQEACSQLCSSLNVWSRPFTSSAWISWRGGRMGTRLERVYNPFQIKTPCITVRLILWKEGTVKETALIVIWICLPRALYFM